MIYDCGCENAVHEPSGIMHSVSKCNFHKSHARDPSTLEASYYAEIVALDGKSDHVHELIMALGSFPLASGDRRALEIGCGVSPYAGAMREQGWRYLGLDCSRWAADWTAHNWDVPTFVSLWEDWQPPNQYGLILCAHAIEHMTNAPDGIVKMRDCLVPGGHLWIIVPDDTDPFNPDHLWYFTQETLQTALEHAGLEVARIRTLKVVERENFIYARCRKPK